MCLVSYFPTKSGFVLSSNRDESPLRDARIVEREVINGIEVIYPADTKGGSWVAASNHKVACLLNGAFKNHLSAPPYRHSRGIMMKQFFEYSDAIDFFENYDLWNIEPFTMIIFDKGHLYEFRWEGTTKYIRTLDPEEHYIWSSCTLYSDEAQIKRAELLDTLIQQIDLTDTDAVQKAHVLVDEEDLFNGLYMDRAGVIQTISHTQIVATNERIVLRYLNLIDNSIIETVI